MNKNNLGDEKSPYLLQHKDNPIYWQSWSEDIFEYAKKHNKLVFVSIGYSTCHWCHVMEKESFEKQDVADLLNKDFVAIKVDREERPDVDSIYMNALQIMGLRGGWPLSMFLTPDKKPIWGGTYFPKHNFKKILSSLSLKWKEDPKSLTSSADNLNGYLIKESEFEKNSNFSEEVIKSAGEELLGSLDKLYGGFSKAPKFPPKMSLMLLLRIANKKLLDAAEVTLKGMFQGGLYDHIGGGFARYSTDERWLIPHFEKMLYDNASLALVYIEAFQLTKNQLYAEVAKETLDYILREMTSPEGGFYSATDADSEGEEGKFFVWKASELKEVLSKEEYFIFERIYNVSENGNFEHHQNNLNLLGQDNLLEVFTPRIQKIRKKIYDHRKKRIHPHLDDKILTSWNGLMISALSKGYQVFDDERYLKAAQKAADFIKEKLDTKEGLFHRYRDNHIKVEGFLEDYAYLIEGLINLYESTFNPKTYNWIIDLQARQDKILWSEKNEGYYFSQASEDLIKRSLEFTDGAQPSPNGVALLNLLRLYDLTFDGVYMEKAKHILSVIYPMAQKYPSAFSQCLIGLDYYLEGSKEIAIIGDISDNQTNLFLDHLRTSFIPNKVIALGDEKSEIPLLKDKTKIDGKTTAYICKNKVCRKPTNDFSEFKELLKNL